MNATDTILYLIELLLLYLDELKEIKDGSASPFAYGEKTAYTECLEVLQQWDGANRNGLDFDIKKSPALKARGFFYFLSVKIKQAGDHV